MIYDKQKLIHGESSVADQIIALANRLSEKDLKKTVYIDGWNAFQVFAHLASFDYARLLRGWVKQAHAEAQPSPAGPSAFDAEAWNQREVAMRMDKSLAEILDEVVAHHKATTETLNGVTQEELNTFITTRAGMSGTVGELVHAMSIEHDLAHLADIEWAMEHEPR